MDSLQNNCSSSPDVSVVAGLSFIHVDEVSFSYKDKGIVPIIQHVKVEIPQSKITSIIGESGSGKSTLLKLIYGLLSPAEGEIRMEGKLIPSPQDKLIPGHDEMKIVSQDFDTLNLYAKVWDNIASQLSNTNIVLKEQKTQEILEALKIQHLAQKRVSDLSGGEKQRVAIGRALVHNPKVLLMDEPFNQVDAAFRSELQSDIRHIVDNTGITVILVSHDPEEVLALSDHLIIMHNGQVVESGNPQDIYQTPKKAYSARLLANSNIVSSEKAQILGIKTDNNIALHREWIKIRSDDNGNFIVKDVFFKGFYKEIRIANKEGLHLSSITPPSYSFKAGDRLYIDIDNYVELTT